MMRTLTPVLSLLIAVLLFFFFTQPAFTEVSALQAEIDEYQDAAESYVEFSKILEEKLNVKQNRAAIESERLDRLVPDAIDDTRLLVDLEAMAESHNMLFGNIAVEGGDAELLSSKETEGGEFVETGSGELSATDISFDVIGTYEQFKDFLRDIEQSLTVLEVVGITFSATDGDFQQFSVTVRTYALPEDN
jgi:hypothetical protein